MKSIKRTALLGLSAVILVAALALTTTSCSVLGGDKTSVVNSFISELDTSDRGGIENLLASGSSFSPSSFDGGAWSPDLRPFSKVTGTLSESGNTVTVDITNSVGTFTATFTLVDEGDGGFLSGSDWKISSVYAGSYQ